MKSKNSLLLLTLLLGPIYTSNVYAHPGHEKHDIDGNILWDYDQEHHHKGQLKNTEHTHTKKIKKKQKLTGAGVQREKIVSKMHWHNGPQGKNKQSAKDINSAENFSLFQHIHYYDENQSHTHKDKVQTIPLYPKKELERFQEIEQEVSYTHKHKHNPAKKHTHAEGQNSIEAIPVSREFDEQDPNQGINKNADYLAPTDEVYQFEVEKINKQMKDHPVLTEKDVEHDNDYYLEEYLADLTEDDLEQEYEELIQELPEKVLDENIERWVNRKRSIVKVYTVKETVSAVSERYNSTQLDRWKPSYLKNYNYQIRPYYRVSQNTMKESISGVLVRFKGSSLFGLGGEVELNRHYPENPFKDYSITFGGEIVKVFSSARNSLPLSHTFALTVGKSFLDPFLYFYGGVTKQQINSDTELNDEVKTRVTELIWAEVGAKYTVNLINNRRMVFFASYSNAVVADSDKAGSRQDSLTGNRFRMQVRADWKSKYWIRLGLDTISLEGATNLDFTTPEAMFGVYF